MTTKCCLGMKGDLVDLDLNVNITDVSVRELDVQTNGFDGKKSLHTSCGLLALFHLSK